MKILVLILSFALSLSILIGCGDKTVVDPEPETDDIVGVWKLTKIVKDGVDLSDDCTARSRMAISKSNTFTGTDYDFVNNECLLTNFGGKWEHRTGRLYTMTIYGHEFTMELYGDTLTADFIHAFDGKHYLEEHVRLP